MLEQQPFLDKYKKLGDDLKLDEMAVSRVKLERVTTVYDATNALFCEGLLHYGVTHANKKTGLAVVQQQLQQIAGEYIKEDIIQPVLLEHARAMGPVDR